MSYNVHITRADHWTNSEAKPISIEESKDYFAAKADFEYMNKLSHQTPFGTLTMGGEFFVWNDKDVKVPFRYYEGRITVSGADDFIIGRMKQVAQELDAIVQGDEGELY
ncbi:hypothetical protein [Paenibacillus sp. P46E]|uniref:hypothetical protein n=1 Tax=Paenibacillus sp. P46E TaxID=1349436 RepID=UPI000939F646|nr:hypothetical protein [Paenibacillus sp. P46E]OKQ00149.1 hypothetical protein A3849_00115 [Paenibacillus sp. P46E]